MSFNSTSWFFSFIDYVLMLYLNTTESKINLTNLWHLLYKLCGFRFYLCIYGLFWVNFSKYMKEELKWDSTFLFIFHMAIQLFQHHLLKRCLFTNEMLLHVSYNFVVHMCVDGSISGLYSFPLIYLSKYWCQFYIILIIRSL